MDYTFKKRVKSRLCVSALLFVVAGLMLFAASPVAGQEGSQSPVLAPLNPDFLDFINNPQARSLLMQTDQQKLGLMPSPVDLSHLKGLQVFPEQVSKVGYSVSYDLRTLGKLTPVRDQGYCGSCWSFATYGSLESILLTAETWDFSENNLKNTHGFNWGHCDGGNSYMSMAYLSRWAGPIKETDDPYSVTSNVSPSGLTPQKHMQEVLIIPDRASSLDNDNIKQALMDYGALYTSMYWDSRSYNATTYSYYYNGSSLSNHAVVIVGWNDDYDKTNFSSTPAGNGAFIVRNSWGPGWGQNGYFYISYYDTKIGNENASFTDAQLTANYARVYQYDPLGWVTSLGYSSNTAWFANIFNTTVSEQLSAVSFYAASPNSTYEIYVYTNATSGPTSGSLAGSKTGAISIPGYHTIPLTSAISLVPGKFSVVVKLTTPGYNWPISMEYPYPGYSSGATASTGQSYISSNGSSWSDITSSYSNTNVCLKAFTTIQYTFTVTKAGTGSGTVTSSPAGINCGADCSESYNQETTVTLTAAPDAGSVFSGWSGDADCSDGQITVNADKTCTATFTLNTYTVTTTATNGTITSTVNPTVNHGSTTTVTGLANVNYYFTGVSGCGGTTQTNTNQSITSFSYNTGAITEDCTVTATFAGTPNISPSPTSLNFGDVNVNTTSTAQTVTFTNTGTADLNVTDGALTGTDASMFAIIGGTCPNPPFISAPSESCNLSFTFTPTSAGLKTGTFTVSSNDPDTPALDIPLSGTGEEQAAQQPVFKEGLEVLVTCPNSVTAGNALTVTVNVKNWDCANSITVSRMMVQLMGNSGGTLSGFGMWGPYNKTTAVKTIPAATCPSPETQTPGTTTAFMPTVINVVPASLGGTMAEVDVDVITSTGETLGSGSCMVNVLP